MKPTNDRPKLGQTTTDAGLLGRRDAFHVPGVLAAVAKYGLEPGSKVKWVAGSRTMVRAWDEDEEGGEPDAIVDPFLPMSPALAPGVFFWVLPWPGKVRDLTHNFTLDGDIAPCGEAATAPTPEPPPESAKTCVVCQEPANPAHGICDDCAESAEHDKNDSCAGCYD